MTDQGLIWKWWLEGQFRNPKYPETFNVTEADLSSLTLDDAVVQLAGMSAQESDANLPPLVESFHHRALVVDGLVGPATRELATLPRCPIPDHPFLPTDVFHYDDPELQAAVESMQLAKATGNGSWPAGCDGNRSVHAVTISYDLSNLTAKHREWWPEIKRLSNEEWAAVGVKLVEVPVGQRANITVYGRVLGGNIIGQAQFNGRTCGESRFCQLNPTFAPSLLDVLLLLMHENGHNMNLQHRPGNIMNPSLRRVPPHWVQRNGGQVTYTDNSYPTLKGYFGGEPIQGEPQPPPPGGDKDSAWIMRVIKDLGREATAVDLARLLPLLPDRQRVAYAILTGHEYNDLLVAQWYRDYLHREPDHAGLANFVRALDGGMDLRVALAVMLASNEYYTRQPGTSVGLDPGGARPKPDGGGMNWADLWKLIQFLLKLFGGTGGSDWLEIIRRILDLLGNRPLGSVTGAELAAAVVQAQAQATSPLLLTSELAAKPLAEWTGADLAQAIQLNK